MSNLLLLGDDLSTIRNFKECYKLKLKYEDALNLCNGDLYRSIILDDLNKIDYKLCDFNKLHTWKERSNLISLAKQEYDIESREAKERMRKFIYGQIKNY